MSALIEINGQAETIAATALSDLLRARGIETTARGFAVAVNGALVPRVRWPETTLQAGDKVEIVRAFAGG
jgi:sulfur carrier protein